nr:type I pullulanase [Streptococcus saliviloxodontae]
MWKWIDGYWGEDASFTGEDDFGVFGEITYPSDRFLDSVHLLVKADDWSKQTVDFQIRRFSGDSPNHIWLVEGDHQVYYAKQAALTSPYLSKPRDTAFDMAVRASEFDRNWGYQGWLGYRYHETATDFRVWSPLANRVDLLLFDQEMNQIECLQMERGSSINLDHHEMNTKGVWQFCLEGDWSGYAYQYRIYHESHFYQDTCDPYTKVLSLDGQKSLIVSDQELVPETFKKVTPEFADWRLDNPCQAVICEMHLRDLTTSESSGIEAAYRGTYLGACQTGSQNAQGDSTAFDHIKKMGYTHVQLQPVFEHHKVYDDSGHLTYNWGYDPEHYNVPDRQFAYDQENPLAPIHELKEMIQAYHEAGIGVIMDVVYNHTYSSYSSPFQLTVPNYFYRMKTDGSFQDGSGCGNETASEKEMFRKYMIDSVLYWAEEYGVDGFRFDLMGLHDVETMRAIREALDRLDPRLLIYGEGWDMGTGLARHQKAIKANANQLPRIGFFNDDARDAVKGAEVYGHLKAGFVSGAPLEWEIGQSLLGSRSFSSYLAPSQVVNYIEAHDNYNLSDLLQILHPADDTDSHRKRVLLATGLNLMMQGMAFMQIGQEFMRTKIVATGPENQVTESDLLAAMNSYNASDAVNAIDWTRVSDENDMLNQVSEWIEMKKHNPLFSNKSYAAIEDTITIASCDSGTGLVSLNYQDEKNTNIIFNNIEKSIEKL